MILFWTCLAVAHPTSPSLLRVEGTDTFTVTWRTPDAATPGRPVEPRWPACPEIGGGSARLDHDAGAIEVIRRFDCRGRDDLSVGVDDGVALVEIVRGTSARQAVATAGARIGLGEPGRGVSGFVRLGGEHLLSGWDHLLLVTALTLRLRGWTLLHALTAFAAGHATSLALATLGGLSAPAALVEPAIALTVLYALAEAAGATGGPLARRPWLVGAPIGLVHGLGFAGGLSALGVGPDGVLVGLFGFNLGLELAQLAVAAAVLGALAAIDRVGHGEHARRAVAWGGGLAAGALVVSRIW